MDGPSLLAGMMLVFFLLVILVFLAVGFRLLLTKRRSIRVIGFVIVVSPIVLSAIVQLINTLYSHDSKESKLNYYNAVATMDISLCEKTSDPVRCQADVQRRIDEPVIYNKSNESKSSASNQLQSKICTDAPETLAIGRDVYPKKEEYKHLNFLGELFTASECGEERIAKIFGVKDGSYTLKPDIRLRAAPSADLFQVLEASQFTCSQEGEEISNCTHWTLWEVVPVSEVFKLKPFADEIQSDGCINCG